MLFYDDMMSVADLSKNKRELNGLRKICHFSLTSSDKLRVEYSKRIGSRHKAPMKVIHSQWLLTHSLTCYLLRVRLSLLKYKHEKPYTSRHEICVAALMSLLNLIKLQTLNTMYFHCNFSSRCTQMCHSI